MVFFFTGLWDAVPLIIAVIMLFGSFNTLVLGIAAMYLSKTYLETKGRPLYVAKEIK